VLLRHLRREHNTLCHRWNTVNRAAMYDNTALAEKFRLSYRSPTVPLRSISGVKATVMLNGVTSHGNSPFGDGASSHALDRHGSHQWSRYAIRSRDEQTLG
jgi:hypothetical protein